MTCYFSIVVNKLSFAAAECTQQVTGTSLRNYPDAIRQAQNSGIIYRLALLIVLIDIQNIFLIFPCHLSTIRKRSMALI